LAATIIVRGLQKQAGTLDEEALVLTESLLAKNPDFGTLFNFRRQILQHLFEAYVRAIVGALPPLIRRLAPLHPPPYCVAYLPPSFCPQCLLDARSPRHRFCSLPTD